MTMHQDLLDESALALKQAYAPYSQLFVGAALRSANGKMYSGCNVESGAFSIGSCAERNAIAAAMAVSATDRAGKFLAIPPCGACRQMIKELGPNAEVMFLGASGEIIHAQIGDLLPHSFQLETL